MMKIYHCRRRIINSALSTLVPIHLKKKNQTEIELPQLKFGAGKS